MTQVAGKNVLITGGASGIGRLVALEMARLGATVIVWDVDEVGLERVVGELKAIGNRLAHGYRCDVSGQEAVAAMAERVKTEVGTVTVLINNAGVVSGRPFLELAPEKIEKTLGVNTLALFWTTQAFLGDMIERNSGHVVTVSSSAGVIGVSKLADYCASKFAAVGFDESLRVELKGIAPGVKTTIVCPYYIDTGMFEGVKTRLPFLLPILKEKDVSRRIIDAVLKDKPRVIMPPMVFLVPLLRLLPIPVFDALANICGINVSMEEFTGRAVRRPGVARAKRAGVS